jgi:hypothetical protein
MSTVYVSTLALRNRIPEDIVTIAKERGWSLEFSSGLAYREDMERLYLEAPVPKMPHNYFPAPQSPFVLNLASTDHEIRERSIRHCVHGLELANASGAPFFSAHAGFCIDPAAEQLGNTISFTGSIDREKSKTLFKQSVMSILNTARALHTPFLVENNVLAGFNYINHINPFLCCESTEIEWIYTAINDAYFGILLDTGHIKVRYSPQR